MKQKLYVTEVERAECKALRFAIRPVSKFKLHYSDATGLLDGIAVGKWVVLQLAAGTTRNATCAQAIVDRLNDSM
jgi:hypothetical protein